MHIYDSRYPTAPTAAFTPPDASVEDYRKVRARLGIERTAVVQPTTNGIDNRCTLAAIAALGDSAHGIAVVDQTVSDAELDRLTNGCPTRRRAGRRWLTIRRAFMDSTAPSSPVE